MKKLLLIIFCIVHCALCIELKSQVVVSASIDSVQMFIGEQAKLTIKAIQPQDYTLQFPIFSDSIASNLELVSTLKPDTVQLENEKLQISNSYIVTAFDSALIYIPGLAGLALWYSLTQGAASGVVDLLMMGLVPFIVGDIVKILGAASVSKVFLPKD